MPFFPDDIICFLAGLSDLRWSRFLLILVLTRPWGLLFASAFGSFSLGLPWWGWIIVLVFSIILYFAVGRHREDIEDWLLKRINKEDLDEH